jgi:hypothetical protein
MYLLKRSAILFFIALSLFSSTFCQEGFHSKKLPANAIRADLLLMRDTMQKVHAGLYRYKNRSAMDKLFDSCYHSVSDSMTVMELYTLTRFIIASIQDGHSNARLPDDQMNEYVNKAKVFPAMVLFIHDRAFILCSKQNDSLAESELLSINAHPMKTVIQRLFQYIQSDAGIESHKNWELPEYFQLLYHNLYGLRPSVHQTRQIPDPGIQTG